MLWTLVWLSSTVDGSYVLDFYLAIIDQIRRILFQEYI